MKYVAIAGIVLVGIFLVVLAFIPLGIEPLTEVYFENHTALPSTLDLLQWYNFSFTIHNLEYQKMRYTYSVDAYDEQEALLYNIDSGELLMFDNETKTVNEQINFVEDFNRTKIVVSVEKDLSLETPKFKNKLWWPDPNYPMEIDIHFWVEQKI